MDAVLHLTQSAVLAVLGIVCLVRVHQGRQRRGYTAAAFLALAWYVLIGLQARALAWAVGAALLVLLGVLVRAQTRWRASQPPPK